MTHITSLPPSDAIRATQLLEKGKFKESGIIGSKALAHADQTTVRLAGLSRRIVSFSLFGSEPGYCETAVLNAQTMRQIYPGWEMWVFHDTSVPTSVLQRLAAAGAHLTTPQEWGIEHWPGTFWRFAALLFPHTEKVIFRDADSVVSTRESALVSAWLTSDKPFHVLRDWYSHVDLILAGLWGAHAPFLGDIRSLVDAFISCGNLHPTHADQHFLAKSVWPRIRDYALVHDSVHSGPTIVSFDAPSSTANGKDALGGFRLKQLSFEVGSGWSGPYDFVIIDEGKQEVCSYRRAFLDGKDSVEIPYEYHDRIDSQQWAVSLRRVRSEPTIQVRVLPA